MAVATMTKRERYELLRSQLDNDRQSFVSHWRELGDYILPRRPRWLMSDQNRGERKNQKIIDSTATMAARSLRSGLMSGITSPARPWFRLTTRDPQLAEFSDVKEWLDKVTTSMSTIFLRSNLYNSLPVLYGDLGVFGTAAMLIDEDFTGDVIRTFVVPVGSYYAGLDDLGRVRIFVRDIRMTVRQIVDKFGVYTGKGELTFDNLSDQVRYLYENGQQETWIDVCHVIMPNPDAKPNSPLAKEKAFLSDYYERGNSSGSSGNYIRGGDKEKYLRESGYDYFPVLVPRWEIVDGDVYGSDCPGMTAIGDVKQLQLGEKKSLQAAELKVAPPIIGPADLKKKAVSMLPSSVNAIDEREGLKGTRPIHNVDFNIQDMELKQSQVRERIRRSFYEDLFLMLSTLDRRQITAREIDERHEEKLLALGPVLEQLNQDLLNPLVDITFLVMLKQGLIPEPPLELQDNGGDTLKVEYISIMAQAQKLAGVGGMERFVTMLGQMYTATQDPSVLDKFDSDQFTDVYGDMLGINPAIVRSDDEVALVRSNRQQAQARQMAVENARNVTGAVKDLSETDTDKNSALKALAEAVDAGNLIA